ncbi:MAG: phosphatase PAP2 family protein [Gemmatimonadota bacterium]|nr:phosphatase PAP2 family protein [Gemmatimonadota bacterium]
MLQGNIVWRADLAARAAVRDSTALASPALRGTAEAANWWGGPGVIWFAAALWLGGRAMARGRLARAGLRGAEALAVASGVSGIIKGLAGRARPFVDGSEPWHWEFNHGWTDARFFSMPSGHTTATTAFVLGALFAMTDWPRPMRLALAAPLVASAVLVAWARMFADQHWLTDVVAAIAIGTTTALVLARVHRGRGPSAYDRIMLGKAAMGASHETRGKP